MPKRIRLGHPFPERPSSPPAQQDWYAWALSLVHSDTTPPPAACNDDSDSPGVWFENIVAPIEPAARAACAYLRAAGLPNESELLYTLTDPQRPGWVWNGMLDELMAYGYGEDSAEYCAARIITLLAQLRALLTSHATEENPLFHSSSAVANAVILMAALSDIREHPQSARFFVSRGRRPGPHGWPDEKAFLDTLADLIRGTHAKGMSPTQARVAGLLRSRIEERLRNDGSASTAEDRIDSTVRLIRNYLPCPWKEFVKTALTPEKN